MYHTPVYVIRCEILGTKQNLLYAYNMYLCTRKLRKHREPAMLTLTVLTPLIPLVIEGRKHASQSLHCEN